MDLSKKKVTKGSFALQFPDNAIVGTYHTLESAKSDAERFGVVFDGKKEQVTENPRNLKIIDIIKVASKMYFGLLNPKEKEIETNEVIKEEVKETSS